MLDAVAVVLPVVCSGCGAPDRSICPVCRGILRGSVPTRRMLEAEGGAVDVWSAHPYEGIASQVILAYKNAGRTDAASELADSLKRALEAALACIDLRDGRKIRVAAIPTSRRALRARGYDPNAALLRRLGVRTRSPLTLVRQTDDQTGLGRDDRWFNTAGSMGLARSVKGDRFLVIDDVFTTGATLTEAIRVLRDAGAEVVGAATIANTSFRAARATPQF